MSGGILPAIARDRIWEAFRALVKLETQQARFFGTYEYTIQATDGNTVDATSNDTETGMPDVSGAELRADTIATQTPTVGQLCHIIFVDGNQAKPKCVWCQPAPQSAAIAGGGAGVARNGDEITITSIQWTAASPVAPSGGGPVTISSSMKGSVSRGSSKVSCG
jgi:hypothetical protein